MKMITVFSLLLVASLASADVSVSVMPIKFGPELGPPKTSVVLTKDNTVTINDIFNDDVTANLIKQSKDLDARVDSLDPLYLVINSPGGSIEAGLEVIENLSNLRRPVHTISVFAASMGFQTAQGLGDRLILKNGTMMSHKPRGGFSGEFPGQLDSRYDHYRRRVSRLDEHAVKRTKGKHTLQSYHNLIENEYWCDGEDCLAQGFADRVITASCDKSLDGVKTLSIFQEISRGSTIEVTVDYDNCPLNTSGLKYTVLINGEPLFANNSHDLLKSAGIVQQSSWSPFRDLYSPSKPQISPEDMEAIKKIYTDVIDRHKALRVGVVKGY